MASYLHAFNKESSIQKFTILSISMFFLLLFTVSRGYNIGAILLVLMSLIALPRTFSKAAVKHVDKYFLAAIFMYALSLIIINTIHHNPLRSYEYSIKVLLIIPIFFFIVSYPIKPLHIFLIILISSLLGSAMGFFNLTHGYSYPGRASVGKINPIHYGSLIQLFACINLIGISISEKINNSKLRTLYVCASLLAAAAGMYLSILSYSRGVWLALPIQLLVIALFFFKYYKKKVIIASLVCVAAIVSTCFIPKLKVKQRINTTLHSITLYNKGDAATSTGMRIDMYKFALLSSQENLILGKSDTELVSKRHQLINEKVITPAIKDIAHLHNHYLDTLAHSGIIALVLLLSVYIFALKSFIKRAKNKKREVRSLAFAGITTLTSYATYGITDELILFNVGTLVFVILLPLLLGSTEDQRYAGSK